MIELKVILFELLVTSPFLYFIYRWKNRSFFDVALFSTLILGHIIINRDLFFAARFATHDTLWGFHAFLKIFNGWLGSGFQVSWIPFINGGEAVSVSSNLFLWAEFAVFSWLNNIFSISVDHLINLFILFQFFYYFFFSYLLFTVIFEDRPPVFITLSFLIFSGITEFNLTQIFGLFLHTPLLLFLGVVLYRTGKLWVFAAIIFVFGVLANHYNPQYTVILLGFWAILLLPFFLYRKFRKKMKDEFKGDYLAPIFFGLALLAVAPAVYSAHELGTTGISPTRGGVDLSKTGGPVVQRKGIQNGYFIPDVHYKFWYQNPLELGFYKNLIYHHNVYYVGAIVLVLALISVVSFLKRDPIYLSFVALISLSVYISSSPGTDLWVWLTSMPFFLLRHGFLFGQCTTFFLIVLSGYGVTVLYRFSKKNVMLIIVLIWMGTVLPVTILLAEKGRTTPAVSPLMSDFMPFVYPANRTFTPVESHPIPFDNASIFSGRASATTAHTDNNVFFRQFEYARVLKFNPEYTVGPIFGVYDSLDKIQIVKEPILVTGKNMGLWQSKGEGDGLAVSALKYYLPDASAFIPCPESYVEPGSECIDFENNIGSINYTFTDIPLVKGAIFKIFLDIRFDNPANKGDVVVLGEMDKQIFTSADAGTFSGWKTIELIVDASQYDTFRIMIQSSGKISIREASIVSSKIIDPMVDIVPDSSSTPNRVSLTFKTNSSGYLIRKENSHPGWSVAVDGEKKTFIEIDKGPLSWLQIVPITEGKHKVIYKFSTMYVWLMYGHIIATILGLFLLLSTLIASADIKRLQTRMG